MAKEYDKWAEGRRYAAGDEVTHHGVHYRARQPVYNDLIVPSASNEQFWEKIGSTREDEAPARDIKVSVGQDAPSKA